MKIVLLLSGGFDSAVAGALLKQSAELIPVHCSQEPFAGPEAEKRARAAAAVLGLGEVRTVHVGSELKRLSAAGRELYFVLMKRLLYRVAARVAAEENAVAIATGENLAQVSSQTATNLAVIDRAVSMPVLRPLLGWDKQQIVDRAKALGVYDILAGPEACDVLGPEKPSTRAKLAAVEAAEAAAG